MSAPFTPGPWYVREATTGGTFVGSDKWSSVLDYGIHNEERRANAQLIAASPDLLAALQKWIEYDSCDEADFSEVGPMLMYADALAATRAAIAKATTP